MIKKIIILSFVLISINCKAQNAKLIKVYCDKAKSSITYSMNHPLHSWTGVNHDVTSLILTDKNKTIVKQVAVVVKISGFDSDNANRDSHTMEVTEALIYPNITFQSDSITQENNKLLVTGKIKFHGVERKLSFTANEKKVKKKLIITGGFTVKMTDFNIEPPSLMAMKTDDAIKITFNTVY